MEWISYINEYMQFLLEGFSYLKERERERAREAADPPMQHKAKQQMRVSDGVMLFNMAGDLIARVQSTPRLREVPCCAGSTW